MYCLRCGKDTEEPGVFCESCLAEMENYPVKPGTPIHIPPRKPPVEQKRRKKGPSTAELLERARSWNRFLGVTVLLLTMVIGVLLWVIL